MSTIQDTDLLLVNRGGTDHKVTVEDLHEYFNPKPPPWEGHVGGIFHLLGDINNVFISGELPIYELGNGEHIVCSDINCQFLFSHSPGEWEFGPLTDTSRVTNMNSMFADCHYFNSDISDWDTSSVTKMQHMFDQCRSFNQDLSQWCVNPAPNNTGFDEGADAWTLPKPVWGTCPRGENNKP